MYQLGTKKNKSRGQSGGIHSDEMQCQDLANILSWLEEQVLWCLTELTPVNLGLLATRTI